MTIITAKQRRKLSAPMVVMAALLAPSAQAADWTFVPTVALKQTYTDNLTLASDDLARAQFITELTPGFSLDAKGRRLSLRARYQLSYFAFADSDLAGTNSSQHQFSGNAKASLIDELLFLDAAGSIGNQAISPFGPQVNDNNYASANRAMVKTYRISPYLKHNFGKLVQTELRYMHDSVDSGNAGLRTSVSDTMALRVSSDSAWRRLDWDLMHSRQRLDDNLSESNTELSNLILRYSLTSRFALTASIGHDSYDYQSLGGATEGQSWSAGLAWTPSTRTSLKASAGKRFFGDSYALTALHRSRHSVWSINYNDAVTTSRAQFLLPATIDTAAMLDKLFAANIADPVARARAVEEYIASNALPNSLADHVNYFSNRYLLQKQFQASAAFRSSRSSLVLSVFDTRREPLSVAQAGGSFEPGITFDEFTNQRGASVLASYSVTARSMLSLSASSTQTESNSTGQTGDQRALRLALTRQFQPKLKGVLELRRVNGTLAIGAGSYRETALSASLSLQL